MGEENQGRSIVWHGEQVEAKYGDLLQSVAAANHVLAMNFIELTSGNDERYFQVDEDDDLGEYLELPKMLRSHANRLKERCEALADAIEEHIKAGGQTPA